MPFHISVSVIVLAICAFVSSNPDRGIDCRKFVFAPLCRGVAAKRGYQNGLHQGFILDATSLNELLRNFNTPTDSSITDEKDQVSPLKRSTLQEQIDNGTFRKDQLHPDRFLYKLFIGSKRRNNNEADNISPYEYENWL